MRVSFALAAALAALVPAAAAACPYCAGRGDGAGNAGQLALASMLLFPFLVAGVVVVVVRRVNRDDPNATGNSHDPRSP